MEYTAIYQNKYNELWPEKIEAQSSNEALKKAIAETASGWTLIALGVPGRILLPVKIGFTWSGITLETEGSQ